MKISGQFFKSNLLNLIPKFSGAGLIDAGLNLSKVGNTIDVDEIKNYSEEGEVLDDDSVEMYSNTFSDIKEGEIVTGDVVGLTDREVLVDVGFKSEGIISRNEFNDTPIIGDKIEVFIFNFEDRKGRLILTKRRADFEKRWAELRDAAENETLLKGTVIKIIKGGDVVDTFTGLKDKDYIVDMINKYKKN